MKKEFSLKVSGPEQTMLCGEIMGRLIPSGSVVGLNGELGAGKTVFVKGLALGLETTEEPNSPTFVIMSCYEGNKPLFHFDVYRLSDGVEFENTGYEEFFYGNGISVVEWAEKVRDALPSDATMIDILFTTDGTENCRILKITGGGKWVLSFKNMVEQALLVSKK